MLVSATSPPAYESGYEADVERALAQRRELRVGLHQRRARIDRGLERAVAALLDVGGEAPAQAVAEVALGRRAARELVRDLQRAGLRPGAGGHRQGARGRHLADPFASRHRHGRLLCWFVDRGILAARRSAAIGSLAKHRWRQWRCGAALDSAGRAACRRRGAGMQNAIAFCDNDVVVVAWSYGAQGRRLHGLRGLPDRPGRHRDGAAVDGGFPGVHAQARADDREPFRSRSSTGRTPTRVWSPTRPATGAFATRSSRSRASRAA